MLGALVRKFGRTAQVHLPPLQDIGKSAEARLRRATGRLYTPDFEGFRRISSPPRPLLVDIGANRGAAAQSMAAVHPDAHIVAFEPNPSMVRRFGSVITNPGGVLHPVALGDVPGSFPLYIPVYRGVAFDGLASLDQAQAADWLGPDTLFGFDPRYLEVRRVECRVETLDSYGLRPFFVKIDVQGREWQVLNGGLATIAASQPIIFAETDTLDLESTLAMLSPWAYRGYRFDGKDFREKPSRTNMYFVPDSKLSALPAG
jgi:FkbM family methyltransferase